MEEKDNEIVKVERTKKVREIFLDDLPKRKGRINWSESDGCKFRFIYDNIKGEATIVKNDGCSVYVKYLDNEPCKISRWSILNCGLADMLKIKTSDFKIEIGTIFKDEKRDLVITDRKYKKDDNGGKNRKLIQYKCNRCGNLSWTDEYALLNKQKTGCGICCLNPKVLKGYNDVSTVNPKLVNFFVNKEDSFKFTQNSGKKAWFKCCNCGEHKFMQVRKANEQIAIYNNISCPNCGDGFSYPEKIMYNVLKQLNIDFDTQFEVKANNRKYRYDFYIPLYGNIIIETHGIQHYEDLQWGNCTIEEQQENDKIKKQLALQNGIKEKNYIIINCIKSELEWIKDNIINSRLNDLFDLTDVDWIKCNEESCGSKVFEVCKYKKENPMASALQIANIFKLGKTTVIGYLKKGNINGWCCYDGKKEINKRRIKTVEIFKDGILLGTFESCAELERQSEKLFGIKLDGSRISVICREESGNHKGFTFKYA